MEWDGENLSVERMLFGDDGLQIHLTSAGDDTSSVSLRPLELVCSRYFKMPVHFRQCAPTNDDRSGLTLHWNHILCELNGNLPYLTDSTVARQKDDHTLLICVPNDFLSQRLKDRMGMIRKAFQQRLPHITHIEIEVDQSLSKPVSETPPPDLSIQPHVEKPASKETHQKRKIPASRESLPIHQLQMDDKVAAIEGEVFSIEYRESSNLLTFGLCDGTSSISCIAFHKNASLCAQEMLAGQRYKLMGRCSKDSKSGEPIFKMIAFERLPDRCRLDEGTDKKRIELHAHTKMSHMDSIADIHALVERASKWGHSAIAITDHSVVQGYPDFYEACRRHKIKPIFGMEGALIDLSSIVYPSSQQIPQKSLDVLDYVVVDIETTGLYPLQEEIIEIGAVRIHQGQVVDQFSQLIDPERELPATIQEITGITPEMLAGKPRLKEVLPQFLDFAQDSILVAHNANFDIGFLRHHAKKSLDRPWSFTHIDTLALSRALLRMKSYALDKVVKKLNLGEFDHHRAFEDAQITSKLFLELLKIAGKRHVSTLEALDRLKDDIDPKSLHAQHISILVQNRAGLKNLYRIVSESHLSYYGQVPLIPKSLLDNNRQGLLLGSGSARSEMGEAYLAGASDDELIEIAKYYDYLEVNPPDAFTDVDQGVKKEDLIELIKKLVEIGTRLNIPVVMSGNVHYLDEREKKEWSVLKIADASIRRKNTPFRADKYAQVNLHFRTTTEMLELATSIFGDQSIAHALVIDHPHKIADTIEEIEPITRTLHPPQIEGTEETIRKYCWDRAKAIYGEPVPSEIHNRLDRELEAIIGHGFSVLYYIAHKIVKKSLDDGYLVGSRGSVGSSLVATLLDITEVNPLAPHYVCPSCCFSEFSQDHAISSGYDLPNRSCPECGTHMQKMGQTIPFETFMGFSGDKIPDIDLNFSGEYQARAHKTIEEMFGKSHVFRAGTISTMADKTAFGYVQRYEDATGIQFPKMEKERIALKIAGVKRTTGQHPGGLMIVPTDKEVYDFTPVQRPANDTHSDICTTHFDYQSIHDDLVKIDALGHDDPTFMKMLKDMTDFDPMNVPMDDQKTLMIFFDIRALQLQPNVIPGVETGTLGIPEFGTSFVRSMLKETHPKSFADLVRISGLSHGTDVWIGNARELIVGKAVKLSEVIACRDDIMNVLIEKGLQPINAFKTMESVRKGKGLTDDQESMMKKAGLPDWFLNSCKKIKYLFPKAHAVAYVSMGFRVAFFKVHMPLAFYATYFSVKGSDFNIPLIMQGVEALKGWLGNPEGFEPEKSAQKIYAQRVINELAMEMLLRGFTFLPVDLRKSDGNHFKIEGNGLRIPLNRVTGLGDKVAQTIIEARNHSPFMSIEDLKTRTSLSESTITVLRSMSALDGMAESSQITLF